MKTKFKAYLPYHLIYLVTILCLTSCDLFDKDEVPHYEIGDSHLGGIIYYIFEPGDQGYVQGEQHGLIGAPWNAGRAQWGCARIIIGTEKEIGSGKTNTQKIIDNCDQLVNAAIVSNLYQSGIGENWFLPSLEELKLLYENRSYFDEFEKLSENSAPYWSSSENLEFSATDPNLKPAYIVNFINGQEVSLSKAPQNPDHNRLLIWPIKYF